jgi:hypothetical protein
MNRQPLIILASTLFFLCEIASLVAWFAFGSSLGGVIGGAVATVVAGAVWGRWMAPKSSHRLTGPSRLAAELVFFTGAAAALVGAGRPVAAAVLFLVAVAVALVVRLPGLAPDER